MTIVRPSIAKNETAPPYLAVLFTKLQSTTGPLTPDKHIAPPKYFALLFAKLQLARVPSSP